MSAPVSDLSFSSVSSSGHVDGLGRRSLSFDRETGAMLERVHVRPELAVFEQILRHRVSHLSAIGEERFARPSAVERDASTGELVVVAEFVTGTRLSELLEVCSDTADVPGVDVALGYLLESLPALATLHTANRAVHGLIDPSRTIITAEGQVVFLDLAFGPAVELLNPAPHRLWKDFGVTTASNGGHVRFQPSDDVAQVALCAVMLVLGRNLRPEDYPNALPSLLSEVIEVAHIRGTTAFAGGLQRILEGSLPLPGRSYESADEMLVDVRQLVRKEIGLDVCRQAVIDFVAQMDAAFASAPPSVERSSSVPSRSAASLDPHVPELDHFLDTFEVAGEQEEEQSQFAAADSDERAELELEEELEDEDETELSLDQMEPVAAGRPRTAPAEEIYDLAALDDLALADPAALSSELASYDERPIQSKPTRSVPPPPAVEDEPPAFVEEPAHASVEEPVQDASEFDQVAAEIAAAPAEPPAIEEVASSESEREQEAEPEHQGGSSRRRKRQQMKSARARKDKLRSTNADQKAPAAPPPPPPQAKPASPTGWHVSPHRVSVPEPHVPEPVAIPQPTRPAHVPAVSFTPSPVGPLPQPTYASPSTPSGIYGSPTVVKPQPVAPPPPVQPPLPAPLKIKADPPAGFTATRRSYSETPEPPPLDRFGTLSLGGNVDEKEAPRAFPWKLAAVAVGVAVVAILLGRTYLPGRTAVTGEPGAPTENASPAPSPQAAPEPKNDSPIPAGKGRLTIQTQPPGIKVQLDRKPIGETPVQIDTTPGRHVLTFLTSGGEVLHSVRVPAGKTTMLDLPVFSGWLSVFAPILLDIAEGGRSIGTTEQSRLMMPPGRHDLTFTNKEFGFTETRAVDIEPGGVRNVTIEARGSASINANPWAEVFLDGTKLGDTPLAATPVPLGTREFVFKHPQHGERKVTATIRANVAAQITVDFTK
jgi:hypothetical protein